MKILVTGGAGFIGSFLVDDLVAKGHEVKIVDNLDGQVHQGRIPEYLNKDAKLIKCDVRDLDMMNKVMQGADVVFHLAAAVGVGQSMYEIEHYVDVNSRGTANMLHVLANTNHDIKKFIVASSMSTYGEGSYRCPDCGVVYPPLRDEEQMKKVQWELKCPDCGEILTPIPTDESKPLDCNSIYAITKKTQEEMTINIGKAYNIPTVSMRFFNVFGPRQSLSNPYTGVAAIFMSRIKNNNPPVIYEDGLQSRDFVSVHDIVQALNIVMEKDEADYGIFNVGRGKPVTIKEIAETLIDIYGSDIEPVVTNKFRKGDVRHCYSDITKIRGLGYEPKVGFREGMRELVAWSREQEAEDRFSEANLELEKKGLV